MKKIEFKLVGVPKGKARPRFFRRGRFIGAYSPKSNEEKSYSEQLVQFVPEEIVDCPINVMLLFNFIKPKSMSKNVVFKTTKPDIDNIAKMVLDIMNGVIFRDDAQIVNLCCTKRYSDKNETIVSITCLEE